MGDREVQEGDIRDERYIDNRTDNSTQSSIDVESQEDVESRDLNIGMLGDHGYVGQSKRGKIGKPATSFGFEK